jgi:hypothetical protein
VKADSVGDRATPRRQAATEAGLVTAPVGS